MEVDGRHTEHHWHDRLGAGPAPVARPGARADAGPLLGSDRPIEREAAERAMGRVAEWNRQLTACALERLGAIQELTVYGPRDPARRSSLVAFNVQGHDPMGLAHALNDAIVEAHAGCHCATLAHQALDIDASCRLSFYLYNTVDEVERAVDALAAIVSARRGCDCVAAQGISRRRA